MESYEVRLHFYGKGGGVDFAVEMASIHGLPLDTDDVRDALRLRVPALNATLEAHREIWTELPPDNYAIFGRLLRPHIFSLLRSPGNEHELQEIFSFLEDVAHADSFALLDVLPIEIVTPLAMSQTERESASRYVGRAPTELVKESEKRSFRVWLASVVSRWHTN
jgi:hypothetical protein